MKRIAFIILSFLFVLLLFQVTPSHGFDSIFSFGDSYTDTGNLNVLAKTLNIPVFTDKLPYGETFFHRPSNRCSDGRLIVDFLAEEFGLPFLKPYLAKSGSYRQGANFAVAGATALDPTFFKKHNLKTIAAPLNISLDFQLQWFKELKPSLCKTTKDCRDYFGRSLFIVGEIGGNDYIDMFVSGLSMEQVKLHAHTIIQTIARTIKEVLDQGAGTVVVPGNIPMGCLPTILTMLKSNKYCSYDQKTGCLKRYNIVSTYHNTLLLEAINEFRYKYPKAKIIYADYYKPLSNFVMYPKRYGFIYNPLVACCGKGGKYNWSTTELCGMPHVAACQNPSASLNWDGVHLTEAAYRYITNSWLKGPYAVPPILEGHKN
ncbi:GDSL esterase/lipase [Rhynchospora pubera]|uniref:GDSL esterase/lipase n=1 Tax=Rhynchospora pubera TaxID=906938 RepID=A0AAV8CEF7_9POAL|nr:GDSL esterase/lipase [Rhynchospora pubera]